MSFSLRCRLLLSIILVCLAASPAFLSAADTTSKAGASPKAVKPAKVDKADEVCVKCHLKLWNAELAKTYVHKPFLEKKCRYCHIEDNELLEGGRGFMADRGVTWLSNRRLNVTSHWFSVPLDKVGGTLIIDLQGKDKKVRRQEIPLPEAAAIPLLSNDRKGPTISPPQMTELRQGLFLEATIEWQTDEDASSQVLYGEKTLNMTSAHGEALTSKHVMMLSGLKPGRVYHFKAISKDLFGNASSSAEGTFSTKETKKKTVSSTPSGSAAPVAGGEPLRAEFYRYQDKLMVKCTLTPPLHVALGARKAQAAKEGNLAASAAPPDQHRLKDAVVTTNTICVPCHGPYVKNQNHPINVPPKPGMEVPPEYFLLANGNITCMTCHSAHSSDFEYRLIRNSKRDLCMGCHSGWI